MQSQFTSPAPFTFDKDVCDAIIIAHGSDLETAETAWHNADYRAHPERYEDGSSALEAHNAAAAFFETRVDASLPDPLEDSPPLEIGATDASLKEARRRMYVEAWNKGELKAAILADIRSRGEPAIADHNRRMIRWSCWRTAS